MSGVEIIGFVLGGLPLLISAAEHYKEGFEPLVKWKRFRKDFIGFIDAVDIEKHLFGQMLERFLISADVPQDELRLLMTDPEHEGWANKDLVKVFQARLGDSYDAYASRLETMKDLVAELQELLCLKNGKIDWAGEGANQWDYQLKRIRLSFSKKGTNALQLLETHNRKLRELLDSTGKLETLKSARRDTSWGELFESIRQHATSLHGAIKKTWSCKCSSSHIADLRLQGRSSLEASTFNLLFETPQKQIISTIKRREVNIRLKNGTRYSNNLSCTQSPRPLGHSSAHESATQHLRRNLEPRPTYSQKSPNTRPVLVPSTSESSASSFQSSIKDVFSRNTSGQSANTSILTSSVNGTETVLAESSTRNWLQSKKPKKSVRIHLPAPSVSTSSHLETHPPVLGINPEPAEPALSTQIHSLCSVICWPVNRPGYLVDDRERHFQFELVPENKSISYNSAFVTLDSLLRGQHSTTLNRRQRYQVASVIASSVLQLQNTPWLVAKLEKRNILFSKLGTDIILQHPYIRHDFESTSEQSDSSPGQQVAIRFAARNSLSNLGIVLLELCFGQVIEDQALWRGYLGPDGKPTETTGFLTARDWTEMVCEEDPDMDHVIRRCVFCMFEEKADWNSKKFTQAVYCSVVEPLERINNRWLAT